MRLSDVLRQQNMGGVSCKETQPLNRCYTLPLGTSPSATFSRRLTGEEVSGASQKINP